MEGNPYYLAKDWHYDATVLAVHDADTIKLSVDLGFNTHQEKWIRLFGLNAHELNTEKGRASRAVVCDLLPSGQRVLLESIKDRADKYGGRWLGIIWHPSVGSLNLYLLAHGHAKQWDGTGQKPT